MIVLLALAGDASEAAAIRGKTDFTAFCFGFSVRVLKIWLLVQFFLVTA